jgi:hypothetical protein
MTAAVDVAQYGTTSPSWRNRIINGAMTIDQRNAGAAVTINTLNGEFPVDRYFGLATGSAGVFTLQQSSTAPAGFKNALIATVGTAATPSSSDQYNIRQSIEGLNVSDLGWGTANAQTVTLSFWVRSSVTGTYGGSLSNSAFDRSYPFTYTISAANTFEYKTITIAGDTSGTWLTTTGVGIRLNISLGEGSTRKGTAGAWAAGDFLSATGTIDWISNAGATWFITGVQLEKGSTATPFEFRSIGQETTLCQRYFQSMSLFVSSTVSMAFNFSSTKRAAPTVASTAGGFSLSGVVPSVDGFWCSQSSGAQITVTASAEL